MGRKSDPSSLEARLGLFRRALAARIRHENDLLQVRPDLPPEEARRLALSALVSVQLDFLGHFPELRERHGVAGEIKTPASV